MSDEQVNPNMGTNDELIAASIGKAARQMERLLGWLPDETHETIEAALDVCEEPDWEPLHADSTSMCTCTPDGVDVQFHINGDGSVNCSIGNSEEEFQLPQHQAIRARELLRDYVAQEQAYDEEITQRALSLEIIVHPIPEDIYKRVPDVSNQKTGTSRPARYRDLINHCRHNFTNYEQLLQKYCEKHSARDDGYAIIHQRVNEAIEEKLQAMGIGEDSFWSAEEGA